MVPSSPCDGPRPEGRALEELETIRLPRRILSALLPGLIAILATAGGATAEPSQVEQQQARAQGVLAQIQQIDSELSHAIEAYNLANVKLDRIQSDLVRNTRHLGLAKQNLGSAEQRLADRVVSMYTSGEENSTVAVLLGASSLDELLDRIETANRVSDQDATTLGQVIRYRAQVKRERIQLKQARVAQAQIVATKASQKASIESQLQQRQSMLAGIRSEIRRIQAAERRRSLAIAASLQGQTFSNSSSTGLGAAGVTPDGAVVAPPSRYGGVVGIAMRYLGVPIAGVGRHRRVSTAPVSRCTSTRRWASRCLTTPAPSGAWARRSLATSSRPATSSSSTVSDTSASTSAVGTSSTLRTPATS